MRENWKEDEEKREKSRQTEAAYEENVQIVPVLLKHVRLRRDYDVLMSE